MLLLAVACQALFLLDRILPPPLEASEQVSAIVTDRRGTPLRAFPLEDGRWRLKASLDEIDPAFVKGLIAYEDKRFYKHWGVDLVAMGRATLDLVKSGSVVSGGSTITMQTARLLEPRPRNIGSKLIEMMRAVQIERRLTKKQILEIYLTHAPYGGNIEGIHAASWAWFGREPRSLTPDQIALLIALPQSPEMRRPDRRPEEARQARERVLVRLTENGLVSKAHAREAALSPIPSRKSFPSMPGTQAKQS